MTNILKIKRSLISVSDKNNIGLFAKELKNFNVDIISTGNTFKELKKYKINAKKFPNASIMSYRSINLPVGPHLKKKDLIYIISKIKNVFKNYK